MSLKELGGPQRNCNGNAEKHQRAYTIWEHYNVGAAENRAVPAGIIMRKHYNVRPSGN